MINNQDLRRYIEGQNETTAKIPGIYRTQEGHKRKQLSLAEDAHTKSGSLQTISEKQKRLQQFGFSKEQVQ